MVDPQVLVITPEGATLGRVENYRRGQGWLNKVEEADYECTFGGFINGRLRRSVEVEIMTSLAGGFAEMEALGLPQHEVGMGIEKVTESEATSLAERFGGRWETLVLGGDYGYALELACKVSGSDDEGASYLEWLERRTLNLMRHPGFWPAVTAVAHALCDRGALSGQAVREVITETGGETSMTGELRSAN